MSSASPWSATRLWMKLRSQPCSRSIASEIRWSCSAMSHRFLSASSIYGCRRMSKTNILGKMLLSQATIHVAAVLLPKLQIDWICCFRLCFEVSEGVITAVQLNFLSRYQHTPVSEPPFITSHGQHLLVCCSTALCPGWNANISH